MKTHTTFRALSQRTQSGRVLLLGLKFETGSENESQPVSGGSSRGGMAPPPASCSASGLSDSCQPQSALVLTVGRHSTSSASPPPPRDCAHISRVLGTESRAWRYYSAPCLTGGYWELPSKMTVITGVSWRACCSWRINASTGWKDRNNVGSFT